MYWSLLRGGAADVIGETRELVGETWNIGGGQLYKGHTQRSTLPSFTIPDPHQMSTTTLALKDPLAPTLPFSTASGSLPLSVATCCGAFVGHDCKVKQVC
jgi:hypothetical protein